MAFKDLETSLAIIIPMFNEELGAKICVESVISEIKKLSVSCQLIIINDGSTDRTSQILSSLAKMYKKYLIVLNHKFNQGYGAGLQSGIKEASFRGFKFCVFMDSDLTNNPSFLPQFVKLMESGYDCVKASRYIRGGKMIGVPFYRKIISKTGNLIASFLFGMGIKDCTNGFRMVRLELIKDIKFEENNFSIILEELYYLKKKGARVKEISNTLTSRINTKTSFSYTPKIFLDYFKYAFKASLI